MKNYLLSAIGGTLLLATSTLIAQPQQPKRTMGMAAADTLPPPFATKSVRNFSKVVPWSAGVTPTAPAGFTVTRFAEGFEHPRWLYVAANGDVFVAESNTVLKGLLKLGAKLGRKIKTQHIGTSANRVMLLRDADKDGIYETKKVFLQNLNQPFGMLILGNYFYVGNTDALVRYPYKLGDTTITAAGTTMVHLPAGKHNRHWARNIITNPQGTKIYIGIGSGTNVGEKGLDNEIRRGCIIEVSPDGTGERMYASGLRNPCGMDWAPGTNTMWTAVNERDEIGNDLVPDYLTSVKEGGFYGWPFSYFGQHLDPRLKDEQRPDLVATAIVPEVPLGSHTASLGLSFYTKTAFPEKYHNGAFIGQHGSWNRTEIAGYQVVFVPFKSGKPSGPPEPFLTGFMKNVSKSEVYGRPVDVKILLDGSLLVTDDVSNIIWQVSPTKKNG